MTSKIQIDEQMIDRAAKSLERDGWVDGRVVAKRVLEAALNPEEPEIPVSEGMVKAAWKTIIPNEVLSDGLFIAIYRAMEKARRKEEVPQQRFHCREGEMRPGGILRAHRRKGDPK